MRKAKILYSVLMALLITSMTIQPVFSAAPGQSAQTGAKQIAAAPSSAQTPDSQPGPKAPVFPSAQDAPLDEPTPDSQPSGAVPHAAPTNPMKTVHKVLGGPSSTQEDPSKVNTESQMLDKKVPDWNTSTSLPAPEKTSQAGGGKSTLEWTTLMSEDFEGDFPQGSWSTYDNDGSTNGEYYWDDDDYRASSGSWSAWAARGGANGVDPESYYYPDNARSWMVYGPVNLSAMNDAELLFSYWNKSEQDYDFLSWAASTNGTDFYGYAATGDSGGWVSENFDLTAVPTLGNITGASSVWVAFIFESDGSNVDEGPFVDDILLQAYAAGELPELAPYTPDGWSSPIVPSSSVETTTTGTLYSYQDTYIDWAFVNTGGPTNGSFVNCLYLDDAELECWTLSDSLLTGYYYYLTDYVMGIAPTPGSHTLRLVVDVNNDIVESDENNNTWQASFYWNAPSQPDLVYYTPDGWDYPIVPSAVPGTRTVDTLTPSQTYFDWAFINNGTSMSQAFKTCIYLDGTQIFCSEHQGMQQGDNVVLTDWSYTEGISVGDHTLRMVVDADNSIPEANEDNNTWEHVFTWSDPCPASSFSISPAQLSRMILNDVRPQPQVVKDRIASERMRAASTDPNSKAPGRYDTSSYMEDSIAVGIILPESNGSMEDWTEDEMNCVVSKIQSGVNWWKTRGGAPANLSFSFDVHKAVPVTVEPIDMSDSEVDYWINQALGNLGFSGADVYEKLYSYTDFLRSNYHTKWAVTYFVADSSNDEDGKFKNSQYFAWTTFGGPNIIMTYDNDGWGIGEMNRVAAHEFGHDFGAGDQYYAEGYGGCTSTTQRYGYLGIENANCEYNNPNSVDSMMKGNSNALDVYASGQIGWRDSNGNNINDVVDTRPGFNLSAHSPDPTTETSWSYTGYVYDQPWTHAVCDAGNVCNDHDITINTITSASYNIDSGGWITILPADGSFDSDYEQISFTTSTMPAGTHTINVRASTSRGTTGTWSDTVTISQGQNPAPALSSISPTSTTAGGSSFTLTANGSNFISSSVVRWNGNNLTTTYVSATQLTASVPAANIASAGTASVTVFNPTPGGGTSSSATFTINQQQNPVPTLNSISPSSATAGGPTFALTVNGSSFVSGSTVRWNGNNLATTYVSAAQLTATVPAANIASAGTALVTVFNPAPGGGTSGSLVFNINQQQNPIPVLSSISPTSATAGGSSFTLTVNGSSFINGSTVRWNGSSLTTTYVSAAQLTASVPAAQIASAGSATITVFNPTPGGGTSGSAAFTINPPLILTPVLSSINPTTVFAGSGSLILTVNGSNFIDGSVVRWDGANLPTTFTSSTQLNASILASKTNTAGVFPITVYTAGAGESGSVNFNVVNPQVVVTGWPGYIVALTGDPVSVTGSGFSSTSGMRWNGQELEIIYRSSGELRARIPEDLIQQPGSGTLTVYSPAPGGNEVSSTIPVRSPYPVLDHFSPLAVRAGGGAFTLTAYGSRFTINSQIHVLGTTLPTNYVSSTEINAEVPADLIASPAFSSVRVETSGPGGGSSLSKAFTVNSGSGLACTPALTISGPLVDTRRTDSYGFTRTVTSLSDWVLPAPEFTYKLVQPTSGWLTLTLTGMPASQRLVVVDGAGDQECNTGNVINRSDRLINLYVEAGHPYYLIVDGTTAYGSKYTLNVDDRVDFPAPNSYLKNNRPLFNWDDSTLSTTVGYTLQLSYYENFRTIYTSKTTTVSMYQFITNLPWNRVMYWRAFVRYSDGKKDLIQYPTLFYTSRQPSQPALVSPSNGVLIRDYTPLLDWSTSTLPTAYASEFSHYQLQLALDPLFEHVVHDYNVGSKPVESKYDVPDALDPNTRYYWRVRSVTKSNEYSSWSGARYFRTAVTPPTLTGPANGGTLGDRYPQYAWVAVDGATGYTLQVSLGSGFGTLALSKTLSASTLSFKTTTALKSGKYYYWRVRASAANGPSSWSEVHGFWTP